MTDVLSAPLDKVLIAKWIVVLVLYLFLPLTTLTYYLFRRRRRQSEIDRVFSKLRIDLDSNYRKAYEYEQPGGYYVCALAYASIISLIGLMLLFLGPEIGIPEFPQMAYGDQGKFLQDGSRLIFGMAFLGAYLWGLQYLFRRYVLNDLIPGVYYSLCLRMLLASIIALVLYNAYEALASDGEPGSGITAKLWPALAFLMGTFPQRGLRWLTERIPMFASESHATVRSAPLEMIEGITLYDHMRLEELGIDTCYDLATADFVPLILKTPYGARELVDWILQAKLCVYFGAAVNDLRQQSIRTIKDLKGIDANDFKTLAAETTLTERALQRAQKAIENDREIERLCQAAELLGHFWEREDEAHHTPSPSPLKEEREMRGG